VYHILLFDQLIIFMLKISWSAMSRSSPARSSVIIQNNTNAKTTKKMCFRRAIRLVCTRIYMYVHMYLYVYTCLQTHWTTTHKHWKRRTLGVPQGRPCHAHVLRVRQRWASLVYLHPVLEWMCDMTLSYVWRDSFFCVTWLIVMCDVTHCYV